MAVAVEHPSTKYTVPWYVPISARVLCIFNFAHKKTDRWAAAPDLGPFIALDWEGVNEMRTL